MACDHQRGGGIDQHGIAIGTRFPCQKAAQGFGVIGRIAPAQSIGRVAGKANIFGGNSYKIRLC